MGRVVAVQLGYDFLPGTTITRYCSSSLQTTRMAFHAIKAGEGDVFISAGVETVSRFIKGSCDALPDTHQPAVRRRPGPHAPRSPSQARDELDDPRDDGLLPDVYIAMGQTAENVARLKRRHAARSRTSSASGRRTTPRRPSPTASSTARSPRSRCPTAPWSARTTAPAPASPSRASPGLKPVFRPDGTVTAGNACPLNDGAAASSS